MAHATTMETLIDASVRRISWAIVANEVANVRSSYFHAIDSSFQWRRVAHRLNVSTGVSVSTRPRHSNVSARSITKVNDAI